MKENKKIDNKMKAKKLAAYTLATCMTVTVAPIGAVAPIMAQEVESVEMLGAASTAKNMTVSIEANITAGMTYKDAVNKIVLTDLTPNESIGTLVSDEIVIRDEKGNKLYDSSTDSLSVNAAYKFEVGKKYTIAAEFDTSEITPSSSIIKVEGNVANVDINTLDMSGYELDLTTSSSALKLDDYPDGSTPGKYAYRNEKGEIQKVTTIAQNKDGWFYVKDGYKTAPGKVIIASNAYGTWLVAADGEVKFNATGLAKDSEGNIVYVKDSKVDTTMTDVVTVSGTGLTGDLTTGTKYNIVNGKLAKGVTVAHEKTTGDWLYVDKDGKVDTGKNGFATNANGTWVIVSGKVDFNAKGAKADTNKDVSDAGSTYFVKGGKIDTTKNETIVTAPATSASQVVQVIKDGVVQAKVSLPSATILQGSGDDAKNWYAVDKTGKTVYAAGGGLATNQYGTWYIENGKVDFTAKGLIKDTGSVVSNDNTKIYYIEGGKIKTDKTGFVEAVNTPGPAFAGAVADGEKYYVENGVVKLPENDNSIFHNKDDGKWYLLDANGCIDTTPADNGIAKNVNGVWKVDNGVVSFNYTGVQQDTNKLIGADNQKKYYFEKGKLTLTKTGVVDSVSGKIYYVENGVVTGRDVTDSVVQKDKDWYSIASDGEPYSSVPRFGANKYGVWKLTTGSKVDFANEGKYTVADATEAKITGHKVGTTLYFKGGKLQSTFTGLWYNGSAYEYVENGVLGTTDKTDILQASDGNWYFVEDGLVSSATTIAENANGKWYVADGKVDFNKTGIVTVSGNEYYVEKGKVSETVNGVITVGKDKYYVVKNKVTKITDINKNVVQDVKTGKWYCIDSNGNVDTTSQFGKNDNGIWLLAEDGSVDFGKSGVVTVKNPIYGLTANQMITVKNGKYTPAETITGIFTGADGKEYYYENGSVSSKTGTYNGKYINSGAVDTTSHTGVVQDDITNGGKDVYIESGKLSTKSGIQSTKYFKNGVEDLTVNGIIDDQFDGNKLKKVVSGVFQSDSELYTDPNSDKWVLVSGVAQIGVPGTCDVFDVGGTKYYVGTDGKVNQTYAGFGYDGTNYYKFATGAVDAGYGSTADFTYNGNVITGKTFTAGVSN